MSTRRSPYSAKDFFLEDLPRTLFPLNTNRVLVEKGATEIIVFAEKLMDGGGSFLPQRRVHAKKDALHLRRTVKLDAVAEFYLYHFVYKHRNRFRKPHRKSRQHFGYRFENGRPIAPSKSYADFKAAIWDCTFRTEEFISFDVSAYFNGIYHHDLHAWFAALCPEEPQDVIAVGKFFREINAGRSLDCLPEMREGFLREGRSDWLAWASAAGSLALNRQARNYLLDYFKNGSGMNRLIAEILQKP